MAPMGQASLEERLTKAFFAIQSARTLGSCDPSAVTSGNVSALKDSSLEAAPRTISIADAVGAASAGTNGRKSYQQDRSAAEPTDLTVQPTDLTAQCCRASASSESRIRRQASRKNVLYGAGVYFTSQFCKAQQYSNTRSLNLHRRRFHLQRLPV